MSGAVRVHWHISKCRGVSGVLGSWQGVWVLRGQKGYRWHRGASGVSFGCRGVGALMEASGGVGVSHIYWGLAGSVVFRGQKGYRWHKGLWGSPLRCRWCWGPVGGIRDVGGVRCVLAAGRECRYSGARRGIGGIRGHWGLLGDVGCWEAVRGKSGASGCRVLGAYWGARREYRY